MELIACKLDQIKPAGHASKNNSSLSTSDIERIHFAEELLTRNLSSPPSTIELAKAIGVSRTKLYRGFNQLYGVSPMEYLRLKRIEKAGEMVKDKDLNMTQIAYALGYSSSSHFTKTFRDFFGMPPSHYRQNGHP
jgi:transcriptional regulator GlxA family with amidase domain